MRAHLSLASPGTMRFLAGCESWTARAADREVQLNVLIWHWGRRGAGAKFTFELASSLADIPQIAVSVSASEQSDLSHLCEAQPSLHRATVRTYLGDKTSLSGKFKALVALSRVPTIARRFGDQVFAHDADVLLCAFQSFWDAATLPTIRASRARFVLVLHDAAFHPGDSYLFRTAVLARQIAAADALIVLSEHVAREAQRLFAFPADRIWTIPHGAFRFGSKAVRPRSAPRGRAVRLLFLGRILKYKGLGCLLQAYKKLLERGCNVVLEIAGDGDLSCCDAQILAQPGLTIVNRWLDESEIEAALMRADIVVLPYVEASQSGVAVSASCAGLPLVVTPVGGLREQVLDGETGLVADDVTPEAVARAIERLIVDANLYEACSSGALRYANDVLDWSRIAASVHVLLGHVCDRPRRSARR